MKRTGNASAKAKQGFAVLCDFDDTVARQNVAEMLLERFGEPAWKQVREEFRAQRLSLKEYQERSFATVRAGREELMAQVRAHASSRPYFKQLCRYCRQQGIPLAIVTHGLDFYVEALLEREGLEEVPYYAVQTSFTPNGIQYSYVYSQDGCQWGNCKCAVVERYQRDGYAVVYAGDGRSDFCPAERADHVFARGPLLQHCQADGIACRELRDFRNVLSFLRGASARRAR